MSTCRHCAALIPAGMNILFCPVCGEIIRDLEQALIKDVEQVSVKMQMVFTVIPFINLWATYRIKKLRKFLELYLTITILFYLAYFTMTNLHYNIFSNFLQFGWIPSSVVMIYPVRKWSQEWNKYIEFLDSLE